MQTRLSRKLGLLIGLGVFCCIVHQAPAQISVGPGGSGTLAFGAQPTVAQGWSTLGLGTAAGAFTTAGNLDNHVITNTAAAAINTALGSSGTLPPSQNAIARWNSGGLYLQTRPTGNDYLLLMAKIQNSTGSNVTHVTVSYDWDQKNANPVSEDIPGHRAFYSLTGLPNSWMLIPAFSTFTTSSTAQSLNTILSLGLWTNGALLYIIWADDNGPGGTTDPMEGGYTIDNFLVQAIPATSVLITTHPQSQSVAPGGSVSLSVSAIGAAPLSYQWLKNSNVIGGATSPSYTINNAALADQAYYSVIVSNGFGAVTSSNAFLTVNCSTATAITSQPSDQALFGGGSLSLTAGVSGTVPITYQWYRNGVPVPNATNSTYTKTNAQPADSGLYRLVANNCLGPATSSNAIVSIANAPIALVGLTNALWRYDQSGLNLGTAWKEIGFNDSAWPTGRGVLAREDLAAVTALTNTVLTLSNVANVKFVRTFYFRTIFNLTNDLEQVSIVASNVIDDGAVFYLNGLEIYRINMNAGAVGSDTLAPGTIAEGTFIVTNIPKSALAPGTNVLAVEVHQVNDTSTDIVFGMDVSAVFAFPSPLVITNQPQNLIVEETKEARFTVGLQGAPAYFQWYSNGVAMGNATTNPLVLPIATTNDTGNYFAVATNVINSVTSSVVTLVVFPDTNAPTLVDADGTLSPTTVLVSFSERVLLSTATNLANYKITNSQGGTLTITNAVLQANGTNVLLTTSASRLVNNNYILIVSNVRDISPRQNIIVPNSMIPISQLLTPIPLTGGDWRYFFDFPTASPGLGWQNIVFDDSGNAGWGNGPAGLAYFGADESGNLSFTIGTGLSWGATSYYFRQPFNFTASPGGARLYVRHGVDDGAIFYFDGGEVLRFNMPGGPIGINTFASSRVPFAAISDLIEIPVGSLLRYGTNVLAAEVHIEAGEDAEFLDVIFAAELVAKVKSFVVGPVIITSGPQNITVTEGSSATFSVDQVGGAFFQWQQNNGNIAGATNDTYTIASVPLSMNGTQFRVSVSNFISGVFSTNATLLVRPDTNGPAIAGAYANNNNTIVVSFSEAVTTASANNSANYAVTNSAGASFTVSSAVLSSGTNVTLSFISLPPGSYFVVINNVKDISVAGNSIVPDSYVRAGYTAPVVPLATAWRFDQSGIDRGPSSVWAARLYDDSGWTGTSNALFAAERGVPPSGTGANFPALPVTVGTSLNLSNGGVQLPSYYFRTHFNSYSSGSGTMTFLTILDDGAVIYLNGAEIFRLGIANNVVPAYATLANRSVGNAVYEGPFTVPITNVLAGDNVIAVEVHQTSLTSSDIEWAGDFTLNLPPIVFPPGPASPTCTNVSWSLPTLNYQTSGTNITLSWVNPVTNNCGSNAVFTLQQSLVLSNATGLAPWANVTPISPFTTPKTNVTRFFRLKL